MFYVYVLHSLKNNDLYIGYSGNLKKRFVKHNNGQVRSTQYYRPWRLIYYEGYRSKKDAIAREKQLKNHRAKEDLRRRIGYSIEVA